MAAINDLIRQIPDPELRERLEQEFDSRGGLLHIFPTLVLGPGGAGAAE